MGNDRAYIEEFYRLRCAPDLLLSRAYPNAKEITEAFAMKAAADKFFPELKPGDPSVNVFCVGDGRTPRAAVTFAFTTRWQCWSIDPAAEGWNPRITVDRVRIIHSGVEDFWETCRIGAADWPPGPALVVLCHAHVQPRAALAGLGLKTAGVIAMPCCVPPTDDWPWTVPHISYIDKNVWSPKNTIHVWGNLHGC